MNQKYFAPFRLLSVLILSLSQLNGTAQTFWTETFGTGCNQGNQVTNYIGTNGSWGITNSGTNQTYSNKWFVSAMEAGTGLGNCGDGCANNTSLTNRTLHIGNDAVAALSVAADSGAVYHPGGTCTFGVCVATDVRAESPNINCTGQSNISLSFVYMEGGDAANDHATLWYHDGTSWSLIDSLPKTINCTSGEGMWTSFTTVLPSSANNNSNVKIGFRWINNDDGVGTDPSFAVDDITLSTSTVIPSPGYTVSDSTICSGVCINFIDTTTGNPTSWNWTFTGGSPSTSTLQNPSNICYSNPGTYDVKLVVANALGSDSVTMVGQIVVSSCAPVNGGFTVSDTTICTFSCVNFTDTSQNTPNSWNWSFPGAVPATSTVQNPTNVCYGSAGTYVAQLIVSNGLSTDTVTQNIHVSACPTPVAEFSASDSTLCVNDCISFTDLSTNNPVMWEWTFPGATPSSSNAQNPSGICYTSPGTYNVTLIASNGSGSDTLVKTMFIDVQNCAPPTVSFMASNTTFCANTCINFTDLSSGNPTNWVWEFPGGTPNVSVAQNPTGVCYNVPGTYDVILTAINQYGSSSDTLFNYITVNVCNPPISNFKADTTIICAGTCTNFTDLSLNGPTAWNWSFPGSLTPGSSFQNPGGICYPNPGTYTVSLIATNSLGSDTEIKTNYMTVVNCVPPVPSFYLPNDTICANTCIQPTNLSMGADSFLWVVEGANIFDSTDKIPYICFPDTGEFTIKLITKNMWGEDSAFATIYVDTVPVISVPNDTITINVGDDANLSVTTPPGGVVYWSPTFNLSCDSCPNPIAHPLTSMEYVVFYIDSNGCTGTDTVFVEVIQTNVAMVPGAFSPNGDGQNDYLYVRGSNIATFVFRVFDRYGAQIFETSSLDRGWNGRYNGSDVNTGVYFWYLDAYFKDGEHRVEKGHITLVR